MFICLFVCLFQGSRKKKKLALFMLVIIYIYTDMNVEYEEDLTNQRNVSSIPVPLLRVLYESKNCIFWYALCECHHYCVIQRNIISCFRLPLGLTLLLPCNLRDGYRLTNVKDPPTVKPR